MISLNLKKINGLDLRNKCVVCNDDKCICKKCENIKSIRKCPDGEIKDCASEACDNFKDWLTDMNKEASSIKNKRDYLNKFF